MIEIIKQYKYLAIITILLASLLTHFIFFGHPAQVVFDEVHFGSFVQGYFTGQYYFDIHPPLGKLMIAGAGKIAGFDANEDFNEIGGKYSEGAPYKVLRLLPMLAGILLPLVLYGIGRELNMSKWASWTLGMLIVLENALLVQSRFILLDAFLLLFGFMAFLMYLRFYNTNHKNYLVWAFIFGAFAISIKWTGLSFIGVIGIIEIIRIVQLKSWKRLGQLIVVSFIAFFIYFAFFTIHFALLPKSGPGDAFMSRPFQKTLKGNQYENDKTIKTWSNPITTSIKKFVDLNNKMYGSNSGLNATHPYSTNRYTDEEEQLVNSKGERINKELGFYTWPFMSRPIFYWSEDGGADNDACPEDGARCKIYLVGNPVIWWLSTFAMIYFIIYLVTYGVATLQRKERIDLKVLLIVFVFAANFLPFFGVTRALFLYHYFPALIVSIIALVYLIDQLGPHKQKVMISLVIIALGFFIWFAPLTYGTPLTDSEFNARMWLDTWDRIDFIVD